MDRNFGNIPLDRILTYPFRDRQSVNRSLLVMALMLASAVIPILPGLFYSGYMIRILRRAVREGEVDMPDWSDPNSLLMDGIYSTFISLVYLLPGILTILVTIVAYSAFFILIIPMTDRMESYPPFLFFLSFAVCFIGMTAGMLLFFLGSVPLPIAMCRLVDEGRLGAAFEFGELFRAVKRNPVGYIVAWGISSGLSAVLYLIYMILYITIVFCCLGYPLIFAGSSIVGLIFMALVGLAYRQGKAAATAGPQAPESARPTTGA